MFWIAVLSPVAAVNPAYATGLPSKPPMVVKKKSPNTAPVVLSVMVRKMLSCI